MDDEEQGFSVGRRAIDREMKKILRARMRHL